MPSMPIPLIRRSEVPLFETVTVIGKEVLPTLAEPRLTDLGESEILGGGALPFSFTVAMGFPGSFEWTATTALFDA